MSDQTQDQEHLRQAPDYPVPCEECGEPVGMKDSQAWGKEGEVYCKPCVMAGAIDKQPEAAQGREE